jgi:hypothetical protein
MQFLYCAAVLLASFVEGLQLGLGNFIKKITAKKLCVTLSLFFSAAKFNWEAS